MNEIQAPATAAPSPKSRRFTDDFKRDTVRLVTEEKYKFKAACPVTEQCARKNQSDVKVEPKYDISRLHRHWNTPSDADGNRTRNLRIDSPVL